MNAQYFDDEGGKSLYLGTGVFLPNVGLTATESNGGTGFIPSKYLDVRLAYHFDLGLKLAPSFGITLLSPSAADGETSTRYMLFSIPVVFKIAFFDIMFGPGIVWYTVSGDGGVVTLPNGSSTADFRLPGKSVTRTFLSADLGLGFNFLSSFRAELGTTITGLISSKRAFNFYTRVSWGLF